MPNYQNGKIYKIHSFQTDLVYYGSTTDTLSRRFAGHKTDMKRARTTTSEQILEYDDAMITLVELFPCDSKSELLVRERFYIENNQCVNKQIPGRTKDEYWSGYKDKYKQWYQDNKEHKKQYQQQNKEKIKIQVRQYREINKEKIKEQKSKHSKQYNLKHKEYISQYNYWRRVNPIGILARAYF